MARKAAPQERPSERAMRESEPARREVKRDAFADSLDKPRPEAFILKNEGDMIVGRVVDFSRGFDPQYRHEAYPIIIIRNEADGVDYSVHCFHEALASGLARENPRIGDRVGIRVMGKVSNRAGTYQYMDYRVKVDRGASRASFAEAAGGYVEEAERAMRANRGGETEPDDDLPF